MRKLLGVLSLLTAFALPCTVFAAQSGVYVAPKFVFGATQMDNLKLKDHGPDPADNLSISLGDDTDTVFGGALAVGYNFDKKFQIPIRVELEYAAVSDAEADKGQAHTDVGTGELRHIQTKEKIGVQTIFANAYYDFKTGTAFTPYVGAGAGLAIISAKSNFKATGYPDPADDYSFSMGSKMQTNFAWNVGLGLGYDVCDMLTIDLGYRFLGLGSAKTGSRVNEDGIGSYAKVDDLYMHQVMLGARVNF